MSVTNKSIVFLALSFAITWAVVIGGWSAGVHETSVSAAQMLLAASMFGPAISALICTISFEKGRRVEALGLHFKPNWWWLIAWLAPIALAAASVALTVLLSDRTYVDPGAAAAAAAEAQGQDLSQVPPFFVSTAFIIGTSVIIGGLINTIILTFSEELGWRGYLHHLWRPGGFWRASLSTGVFWGIWHAPAIYLIGHNYPDNRPLGVGLFVIFCILLSPIMTLIRDRAKSVWAAGIFHGTFNALGGLTILAINNPAFPWNGIVGIGGFAALALACIFVLLLQRKPAAA